MRSCSLSIVVPCYNEEATVDELYRRVIGVCGDLAIEDAEIVLVDDGSTDATWAKLSELGERDDRVVAVRLASNHGHQLALTAGLSVSRGERVLIIDADLQDPPELLGEMMALMGDGADVVYGVRRRRIDESLFKKGTAALFYRFINWISSTDIPRDAGDFRLVSRRVVDVLLAMPERRRFIRGMVSWIGFRQVPILYDRQGRHAGKTKYPLGRMLRLAGDGIVSFSTKPLTLATWLGFGFAVLSAGFFIYSIVSWIVFDAVRGWTSILAVISLLGGIQLVMLGVIGEYLGRLYEQSQGRPLFIIQDTVNLDATGAEDHAAASGSGLVVVPPRRPASIEIGDP